jgi:hypothetical protein
MSHISKSETHGNHQNFAALRVANEHQMIGGSSSDDVTADLKKVYHPPVLTVYGTASEIGRLNVDSAEILAKLENRKRLLHSPA